MPRYPDVDLRSLRELAEHAARAGGDVARQCFHAAYAIRHKADGSEVTEADEAAQAAVIAALRARRPHDALIAEESLEDVPGAAAPADDVLCWIIDPIDGTRNYVRGIPLYAVAVAAMFGGYPVAAAIYIPDRDDMYSASRAEGFLVNGTAPTARAVKADTSGRARKPLAGIPSSFHGAAHGVMQDWMSRVVVRNLGSTATHLAMVAAGQFQAALVSGSRLWDIAAGWLLIDLTGGVMTTLDGRPVFPFNVAAYAGEPITSLAACDPQMHARLLPGARPPS